jgi:NCAIR mutase (PurE)-related protein
LDFGRAERIGLDEAVFCIRKSSAQIEEILAAFAERQTPCLLTHLSPEKLEGMAAEVAASIDYDPVSQTGFFLEPRPKPRALRVAIVSGGTSDAPVVREAARTLAFYGVEAELFQDVGVTGLWRLMERLEQLRQYPIIIAVAGMEGAIFSVLGGLVDSLIIAVPTSVGYGVGPDGQLALHSALGSCAPGILVTNIDNGFGAACAALRVANRFAPEG